MSNPVVSAKNLGKSYWLYPNNTKRVLGCFFRPQRVGGVPLKALSGLTFDLYPGEALALIGKNGAGKSTALQLLTGILQPSEGEYITHGRLCALLELGSGFNTEFTGRQNIHIAGLLTGLRRDEIIASEDFIVEFADIGSYIDQPVKFYSSGMFLRLAFAVALAGNPDVLIVDEALAVGDIFFRQKCYSRLRELRAQGMAVLLVTHSMSDVTEFCERALLLDKGKMVFLGECKEAVLKYYALQSSKISNELVKISPKVKQDNTTIQDSWTSRPDVIKPDIEKQVVNLPGTYIKSILMTDEKDNFTLSFHQGQRARIYVEFYIGHDILTPVAGFVIWNSRGIPVHGKNVLHDRLPLPDHVYSNSSVFFVVEVELDIECGEYTLNFGLTHIKNNISSDKFCRLDAVDTIGERVVHMQNCLAFCVNSNTDCYPLVTTHHGIANLNGTQKLYIKRCD